jgi:transcriptional regulator with XRE-family HTH domain
MDTIGLRLKNIISGKELSLIDFAAKVGIQRSSLSHLFSGRNKPSIDLLLKIKHQFPDIDLEWLITGDLSQKKAAPNETLDKDQNSVLNHSVTDVNFSDINSVNQRNTDADSSLSTQKSSGEQIERIIIFYKNGSFIEYNNK